MSEVIFVTYDENSEDYTIERFEKTISNKFNEDLWYKVNVKTRKEVIEYVNLYEASVFSYSRDELGEMEIETLNTYFGPVTEDLFEKWQNYKEDTEEGFGTEREYRYYVVDYESDDE